MAIVQRYSLNILKRLPLSIKMAVTMLAVGLLSTLLVEHFQSRSLRDIFVARRMEAHEEKAKEDLYRFVQYLEGRRKSIKVLVNLNGFHDYLDTLEKINWSEEKKPRVRHYTVPPAWFPSKSITRALYQADYAILFDPFNRPRETYQNIEKPPNAFLEHQSGLLPRLINSESVITAVEGVPFQVITQPVYSEEGEVRCTVMFAFRIDSTFFRASQGAVVGRQILALLDKDRRILASTHPETIAAGTPLAELTEEFCCTTESFFQYGGTEVEIAFVSLVSRQEIEMLTRHVLALELKHGLLYALAFIFTSTTVVLFLARRIRLITADTVGFLRTSLGREMTRLPGGDEVFLLATSLRQLQDSVTVSQRRLQVVRDVGSMAGATLDIDQVLRRVLVAMMEILPVSAAAIFIRQLGADGLRLGAASGLPEEKVAQLREVELGLDEGLTGMVVRTGEPVFIPFEAGSDPRLEAFLAAGGRRLNSFARVPLFATGEVVGVLDLMAHRPERLNEDDIELATAVGAHVGFAIRNAQLFQETIEAEKQLKTAYAQLQEAVTNRERAVEKAAVMEERGRLARELHDSVTQSLYSVTLFAESSRQVAAAGDLQQVQAYLKELVESASGVLKELRLLVYDLRPAALEEEGLAGALRQRLEAVEQRSGIKGSLEVEGESDLPPQVEEGLYRIAQEALNNAFKHAAAKSVHIRIVYDKEVVTMVVTDDGIGFNPDARRRGTGGMGLSSMRERAEKLGGRLLIDSIPGSGTRIRVEVHLNL